MQDRYLFRGKTVEGVRLHFVEGHYVSTPRPMIVSDKPRIGGGWHFDDIDPATIGQCTGLRDKNGKLIFEGDIVKTKEFGKCNGKGANFNDYDIFSVTFCVNAFCVENGTENNRRRFGISACFYKCEIIGNIHDNPELLTQQT